MKNGEIDPENFDRVVGHLKRATFDSFKLTFEKSIREKFNNLSHIRYENVEDGQFQPRIRKMFNDAKEIAEEARKLEHPEVEDYESWGLAFDKWQQILPIADQFKKEENSEKILRVKNPGWRDIFYSWKANLFWSFVGAVFGVLLSFILKFSF